MSLLALQRSAGNRAVTEALSRGRPPQPVPGPDAAVALQRAAAVQRQPTPATTYVANPAALADCANVLRRLYDIVDAQSLEDLRRFKTVAVGMAVEKSNPDVGRLVWTANGNWNDPAVSAGLASLNVRRWDPGQSRTARGPMGAPGDAEQRMLDDADDNDFVVKAMAVSRPLCPDCAAAVGVYGQEHGRVLVEVVPPPTPRERDVNQALASLVDAARRLRGQVELYYGEHQLQLALITTPSFSGFAGYWANRLFNREIPQIAIWNNAFGSLAALDSSIRARDVNRAMSSLIRARRQHLLALKQYVTWKDGVEGAGQRAQVAIGVVAIAAIVAVVAPTIVATLAESGAGAGSLATTEQATVRIAAVIAQADETMIAAEALMTEAELAEEAELVRLLAGGG